MNSFPSKPRCPWKVNLALLLLVTFAKLAVAQQVPVFFPPVGATTWIKIPDLAKQSLAEKTKNHIILCQRALEFQREASKSFSRAIALFSSSPDLTTKLEKSTELVIETSLRSAVHFSAHIDSEEPLVFFYSPISDLLLSTKWSQTKGVVDVRYLTGNNLLGLKGFMPGQGITMKDQGTGFQGPLGLLVASYRRVAQTVWDQYPVLLEGKKPAKLPESMSQTNLGEAITPATLAMLEITKSVLDLPQNNRLVDEWLSTLTSADPKRIDALLSDTSPLKSDFIASLPEGFTHDQIPFFATRVESTSLEASYVVVSASRNHPSFWMQVFIDKNGRVALTGAIPANTFIK